MLRRNCLSVLAIVLAVACAAQAIAEESGEADVGYRSAGTDGGFQLVEHGIWAQQVAVSSNSDAAAPPSQPLASISPSRSTGSGTSNSRRATYLPHVQAMEAHFALPRGLLDALVWTESRYDPLAISKAGAGGLGQLMPATARELGVANRFDPRANLEGSARYLRQMLDEFGVVHLALAAYNAGPGAVRRAGGIPKNGETPRYVRNVLRHWRFRSAVQVHSTRMRAQAGFALMGGDLIVITDDGTISALNYVDSLKSLIGNAVTADGVIIKLDRLQADWGRKAG